MAWVLDAPSGVYKDHALSSDIRMEAIANLQFGVFASQEDGYGKSRGESITVTRFEELPLVTPISELDKLPTSRPDITTVAAIVEEYGHAIEHTQFERDLTHFDITNQFQQTLISQMRRTMDKVVSDAMRLTQKKFVSTSATAGSIETGSASFSGTATHQLSVDHLRLIKDEMEGNKIPGFGGTGQFAAILSTAAARGIKNDDEYKDWTSPTSGAPFINGELKTIEGIRLIETNHVSPTGALAALGNALGTNSIGEAVFFGDDPAFMATVREPELMASIPDDFGRFRKVAWVGETAAGNVWANIPALTRVIHFGSA